MWKNSELTPQLIDDFAGVFIFILQGRSYKWGDL